MLRARLITVLLLACFIGDSTLAPLSTAGVAPLPAQEVIGQEETTSTVKSSEGRIKTKRPHNPRPEPAGLSFEPNVGQSDKAVSYLVRMRGGAVFFTPEEIVYSVVADSNTPRVPEKAQPGPSAPRHEERNARQTSTAVKQKFIGANTKIDIAPGSLLPGKAAYLLGNDPTKWQTNVPTYAGIVYRDLYPGINLQYDGSQAALKGTYHIAAGVDPARIRWRYEDADKVFVDSDGDLQIRITSKDLERSSLASTGAITITERAPIAWQVINGLRAKVAARFAVAADGTVGFELGKYDKAYELTLDPEISYRVDWDGETNDVANGVTVDSLGNAYVIGSANLPNLEGGPATADARIMKLNQDGTTILLSMYLGGAGNDYGYSIAVDPSGDVYVSGTTESTDFPTVNAYQPNQRGGSNAFITRIEVGNPLRATNSTIVYSTYLGGEPNDPCSTNGTAIGYGIAADEVGNAYVTGYSRSWDFPLTQGVLIDSACGNAFAAKLDTTKAATQSLVYSGILAGPTAWANAIAIDGAGNAYITGYIEQYFSNPMTFTTHNALQPTYGGAGDAFLSVLNPSATAYVFSTYLGGSGRDDARGVALDPQGNIYIAGITYSEDFPNRDPLQPMNNGGGDAFITKINSAGTQRMYSSYLGGEETDQANAIAVDSAGQAYVTGYTESSDFPVLDAIQTTNAGDKDTFVTKLNGEGSGFVYSTYFGAGESDFGNGIAADPTGSAYVVGGTASPYFRPAGAYIPVSLTGSSDAFIIRIDGPVKRTLAHSFGRPGDILGHEIAAGYDLEGSNMATGNMVWQETDLWLDSPGLPFDWWRTYNSRDTRARALGRGWSLGYDAQLTIGGSGIVTATLENGAQSVYTPSGGGYIRPPAEFAELYHDGDGTYRLLRPDQTVLRFSSAGKLQSITDSAGRSTDLFYSGANLSQIIDSSGRGYTIASDGQGRVKSITDFSISPSRSVVYTYTGALLTQVKDLRGNTTEYQYQNNRLSKIILADGGTRVENQYDSLGRVTWQRSWSTNPLSVTYDLPGGFANGVPVTETLISNLHGVPFIYSHDVGNRVASVNAGEIAFSSYQFTDDDQLTRLDEEIYTDGVQHRVSTAQYDERGNLLRSRDATNVGWDHTYDNFNRLTSSTDTLDHTTGYDYTSAGLLQRIEDHLDHTAIFTHTEVTISPLRPTLGGDTLLLESEKDELGRVTRYEYNAFGQPKKIINALNQETILEYDPAGRLVKTTDPGGVAECREYDAADHLTAVVANCVEGGAATFAQNVRTEYGYDLLWRLSWQRNPLGEVTRTFYNAQGRVSKVVAGCAIGSTPSTGNCSTFSAANPHLNRTTTYTYDALGRQTSVADTLGVVTHTTYDELSHPQTVTANYIAGGPSNSTTNLVTIYTYDEVGQLIEEQDPLGRLTRYTYDLAGRPRDEVRNAGVTSGPDRRLTTRTEYNLAGLPIATTYNYQDGVWNAKFPDEDVKTVVDYDELNRVTSRIETYENDIPNSGNQYADRVTSYQYDAVGNVIATTDPMGRVAVTSYDKLNRPLQQIANCTNGAGQPRTSNCAAGHGPDGDENISTSTTYTLRGQPSTFSDPLGRVTHTFYDGMGRPEHVVANEGGGIAPANVTTRFGYDKLGNTTVLTDATGAETRLIYNSASWLERQADPTGVALRYFYDGLGRQVRQTDALNRETRAIYDKIGRVEKTIVNYQDGVVQAADGRDRDLITARVYDKAGRLDLLTNTIGRVTDYNYDGLDRLTQVTLNKNGAVAPANVTTVYGYDRRGLLTSVKDPRNNTRQRAYNGAGWLDTETDALGRSTSHAYNRIGQLAGVADARPQGSVSYDYDDVGRLRSIGGAGLSTTTINYDLAGRRANMVDETGTTTYTYDGLDRLNTATHSQDGTVTYGYDLVSRRTSLSTSTGAPTLGYEYDRAGRLKLLTRNGVLHARADYDVVGRLKEVKWGASGVTIYDYDGADRLTGIRSRWSATVAGSFSYTLDRGGQVSEASERIGNSGRRVSYTYDGLQRLTGAVESPGSTFSYAYDTAGNRTQVQVNGVTTESRSYDAADQVVGWTYDAAGNLLNDGTNTYTYNPLSRLTAVTVAGATTSFKYNGDGILARQTSAGSTTNYILDTTGGLSERLGAKTGSSTTWYVRGWGMELNQQTASSTSWFVADRLGSIRSTISQGGGINASYNYDPYGNLEGSASLSGYGFTGEPQNTTTDLVQLRARWYSTTSGKFLTHDPVFGQAQQPMSFGYYLYGFDDPSNRTDPTGMLPWPRENCFSKVLFHNASLLECWIGGLRQTAVDFSTVAKGGAYQSTSWLPESTRTLFLPHSGENVGLWQFGGGVQMFLDTASGIVTGGGRGPTPLLAGIDDSVSAGIIGRVYGTGWGTRNPITQANSSIKDRSSGAARSLEDKIRSAVEAQDRVGITTPDEPAVALLADGNNDIQAKAGWGWHGREFLPPEAVGRVKLLLSEINAWRARNYWPVWQFPAAKRDRGTVGIWHMSHSELKVVAWAKRIGRRYDSIGVSREMCEVCQYFFSQLAEFTGETLVVADPKIIRIFRPDGSIFER